MTVSRDERLAELHRQLDEIVRPLAKCPSAAADESEVRAARLYRAAFLQSGLSGRGAAERMKRDERSHRDYMSGARAVPIDAVLRLPRAARVAFVREFVATEEEAPESQLRSA